MTSSAEVTFRTGNADVVARALSPELSENVPRTKVRVTRRGDAVVISVEAEDHAALRAALNSYIRWANVADETAKEVGKA